MSPRQKDIFKYFGKAGRANARLPNSAGKFVKLKASELEEPKYLHENTNLSHNTVHFSDYARTVNYS